MARPKGMPTTQLNVRIPEDLAERVRERLRDPLRNKTKHSSVTSLVTALLYDWAGNKDISKLGE